MMKESHSSFKFIMIIFLGICQYFPGQGMAQNDWKEIKTVEQVMADRPQLMVGILEDFNLDYTGLENVKQAYVHDSIAMAFHLLLDYNNNGNAAPCLRTEQSQATTKRKHRLIRY